MLVSSEENKTRRRSSMAPLAVWGAVNNSSGGGGSRGGSTRTSSTAASTSVDNLDVDVVDYHSYSYDVDVCYDESDDGNVLPAQMSRHEERRLPIVANGSASSGRMRAHSASGKVLLGSARAGNNLSKVNTDEMWRKSNNKVRTSHSMIEVREEKVSNDVSERNLIVKSSARRHFCACQRVSLDMWRKITSRSPPLKLLKAKMRIFIVMKGSPWLNGFTFQRKTMRNLSSSLCGSSHPLPRGLSRLSCNGKRDEGRMRASFPRKRGWNPCTANVRRGSDQKWSITAGKAATGPVS